MKISFGTDYVRDFAQLCEKIPACEIPDVASRIIDVLPYVLECEFGIQWEKQKSKSLQMLRDHAYESALIALVPEDVQVAMTFDRPSSFIFADKNINPPMKAYFCNSESYALSLISAYLQFLADRKEFIENYSNTPLERHLKLVHP